MRFEWDPAKATANVRKHRISFELAARIFSDPFALAEQDRVENGGARWQTLGLVDDHLLFIVAHTVWDDDDGVEVIRIVSARRADQKERRRYEKNYSL